MRLDEDEVADDVQGQGRRSILLVLTQAFLQIVCRQLNFIKLKVDDPGTPCRAINIRPELNP